ncbi:MAG: alpha/beta hydrolase [Actinomycetota bacterium]|nr:alpha/beta hydrolase [Actinomycetota bacterium]MDQ6947370.1 alpha/beta hydrolase [Actinomycetota bacterium]
MAPRKSLIGLAVAGAAVAGGIAAERAMIRAQRQRLDPEADVDTALRPEVIEAVLTMSDGARLRVLQQGTGPAIILLHGITLAAAIWHYQLPALAAAGYHVVAYDQRGHGTSTVGREGVSLDRLAADLAEVLDALDLRQAVLVGHSMGGMVALRYLSGDPDAASGQGRIGALALVATSANPAVGSGIPGARAVVAAARPLLSRAAWITSRLPGPSLGDGDLSFLLARVTFGDEPSTSQVALTRDVTAAVPAKVAAGLLAEIVRFDETATLACLDLPSAIVVGTNDVMTPVRHARAMADIIGGADLVTLEGCGHMVMLERPVELGAALAGLAGRVKR